MTVQRAVRVSDDAIHWVSEMLDGARYREATADFDLRAPLDRGEGRANAPQWRLLDHDGNVRGPARGERILDHSMLEVVLEHLHIEPLFRTMRRIHIRKEGFYLAVLVDGGPGPWTFFHGESISAHEVMELVPRFEADHPA